MSILRAKTQMLKQKERLIAKIALDEQDKINIDIHIGQLQAQIEAIDAAITALGMTGGDDE